MIGIEQVGFYIPESRIDTFERAKLLGVDPSFVKDKIGFLSLAIKSSEETTVSMAISAVQDLFNRTQINPAEIEALIVVTQNPDRNIPHVSAEVHGHFSFGKMCACFDISLGCSGYVYGLSVLSSLMQANNFSKAILVTADPYSKIVRSDDKNTALIFGDAATATLLTSSASHKIGKVTFGTLGNEANNLCTNRGELYMNGRAVFNFAAGTIPENITQTLNKNDLNLEDVDSFIFHQGSKYMLDTITQRLKITPSKVRFSSENYGNTVSSSIPLILVDELKNTETKNILLCGFGLGFSYASTIIRNIKHD